MKNQPRPPANCCSRLLPALLLLCGWAAPLSAQVAIDLGATPLSATSLRLDWTNTYSNVTAVNLYRRTLGSTNWGSATPLATNASNRTETVVNGTAYEYRLDIVAGGTTYYGYLAAGVNVPLMENRGTILLIVDNTMAQPLAAELEALRRDLVSDGWKVIRHDVARMAVDPAATGSGAARLAELQAVKNLIVSAYNADPSNVRQVLLIGRVPVPYSGNIMPDGHSDHIGAWPADAYYADTNGSWTDTTVNSTSASDPRNRNVPGDGKFDQGTVAAEGALELAVGRIDFANMTLFPAATYSERELLRRYLNKARDYRHKRGAYAAIERRSVGVPWGDFATGCRSSHFAVIGRAGNLLDTPSYDGDNSAWFRWMEENPSRSYLHGFGQGGGNYQGAANVGTSRDFGLRPSRAVFTSFFGSYFADWDTPNNFLRASLAGNALGSSLGLCAFWSGRPHFYLHQMALGQPLGTATRAAQHFAAQYFPAGDSARGVHAGLLGDPALRLYAVEPPRHLRASVAGGTVTLQWEPSAETGLQGYLVYSADSPEGPFTKRTSTPQAAVTFTDSVPSGQQRVYYVRTVKTETTPGGTFTNASVGSWITITSSSGALPASPSGLSAQMQSSAACALSWQDNSANETGFRVERASSANGTFSPIAVLGADTTAFTDSGPFTAGVVYYYRVFATGSGVDSPASDTASALASAGYFQPAATTVSVDRVSGQAAVAIRRLGGAAGAVSLNYTTANVSAVAGQHYTATSGTLTWADGDAGDKVITIPVASAGADAPRSFKVNLSGPSGGAGLSAENVVRVLLYDSAAPVTPPWVSAIVHSAAHPGHVSQLGNGTEFASLLRGGAWFDTYERGRFIHRPVTGDQIVTVRIEAPSPSSQWNPGTYALCARDSLDQTGRMAAVYVRDPGASGGVRFLTRNASWSSPAILPSPQNTIQPPCWLRLRRQGNTFTGEVSADGATWTTLGSGTIANMPETALWGFFQVNNTYLEEHQLARFTNVQLQSPPVPEMPGALAVTGLAPATIRVTWTPPEGATQIVLERSLDGAPFAALATLGGTASFYNDTAGAANSYTYRVRAANAAGSSEWNTTAPYTRQPHFQIAETQISGGNGDAIADRNEAPNLAITLSNTGLLAATGVSAVLSTSTPGVTILEPVRAYPDLAVNGSVSSALPFVLDLAPDIPPGTQISFTLAISSAQGTASRVFNLPLSEAGWRKTVVSTSASLVPGTANTGNSGDDVNTAISLPFSFNFGGQAFSSVNASSNGNLQFTTSSTQWDNQPPPVAALGAAALVFWDDLRTNDTGRGIFTSTTGTAPNRVFNIEWRALFVNGSGDANFQARLFENQARVDFIYGTVAGSGSSATVGVQVASRGEAVQHSHNQAVITPGLHLSFEYSAAAPLGPGRPDTDGDGLPDWWTVTHFGSRTGSASSGSRAADSPAGDGIPNLVKYALGLPPLVAGSQGRLASGVNGGYLTFTVVQPEPPPPEVTLRVESSSDLSGWTDAGNTVISSTVQNGLRTTVVRDSQPLGVEPRRFMRLRAAPSP